MDPRGGVGTRGGGRDAAGGAASGRGVVGGGGSGPNAPLSEGPAPAGSLQRAAKWFRSQAASDGSQPRLSAASDGRGGRAEPDECLQRDNSKRVAVQYAGSPMDADDGGGGGGGGGGMRHADIYACPSEGPEGGFKVGPHPGMTPELGLFD